MQRTNYFPKNTPEPCINLIDFLINTYPLQNTEHLIWEFQNRDRCGKKAIGLTHTSNFDGNRGTTCLVALGFKDRPVGVQEVLLTMAHEYCHAMQYDQGLRGDCTPEHCVEADLFADQVVFAFLGGEKVAV